MDDATVEGNYEQKLISSFNRAGLTAKKISISEFFFFFFDK